MSRVLKLSEKGTQAYLMRWLMDEKNHDMAVPNITTVFWWECDLLSVTRAGISHEFEIKRSISDYRAEFKNKASKHITLQDITLYKSNLGVSRVPNYFWFVTVDLEIKPPEYAGWIQLMNTGKSHKMWIKKKAPRLHKNKLNEKQRTTMGRILSYRLKDMFWKTWVKRYFDTKGLE